jgi:aspartyl-tRNA(Asn)/glutamyl-tRNA(Gln) amidotransferase subunit B
MELVTEPVIHDSVSAVRFAKELQLLLRELGAGEANMEKGEMRVEANISVSSQEDMEAKRFGTKTEVKNLNSFRSVERATEFEIARQIKLLENGEKVVQETRGWDDSVGETYSQRSKESSHDYRYFPDPDIPKLKISLIPEFSVEALKKEIPELPSSRRARFQKVYSMTDKEVAVFVDSSSLSKYFESIISPFRDDAKKVKLAVNYLLTDYLGLLKKEGADTDAAAERISSSSFAELVTMIAAGDLSSRGAKDLLVLMLQKENKSASPRALADKNGLIQKSDAADISPALDKVIADNAKVVAEYKSGKVASLQFLIGQAMKATKGAANPEVVRKLLTEKLA